MEGNKERDFCINIPFILFEINIERDFCIYIRLFFFKLQ